ncbi:MAG TPA: NAD(P)H-dependent oxidoreductase [Acidimicrobiales bacterium]|nr:NAD(P)H-dependent oxidoreductase [Acidimicrobiales bacterium]
MTNRPLLSVIIASTRSGRIGEAIATSFAERARGEDYFDVELVDLATVNLPIYDEPQQAVTRVYVHEHTRQWSATIARSDALVFVMPEYNHSFNAALKNALDFLYHEWRDKPVGLVGYGGVSSGTRAMQALKPVLLALKLAFAGEVAISTLTTPVVDGVFHGGERFERSATTLLHELARLDAPLRALRQASKS